MNKFFIGLNILYLKKCGITDSIDHIFARIRIDSYNPLPSEKNIDFS